MPRVEKTGAVVLALALCVGGTAMAQPQGHRVEHGIDAPGGGRVAHAGVGYDGQDQVQVRSELRPQPVGPSPGDVVELAERALPAAPHLPQPPHAEPPADAAAPHLPDLAVAPAEDVFIGYAEDVVTAGEGVGRAVDPESEPDELVLRFTTTIRNIGTHSLELLAVPAPGSAQPATEIRQCVEFAGPRYGGAPRLCVHEEPVTIAAHHPHHSHVHLDGFARYELRRDAAGRPDRSPSGLIARREQSAFCFMDTAPTTGAYEDRWPEAWYGACGMRQVPAPFRQGLSPGWAHGVHGVYAGQELPVRGLPDGVYWIAITVNPPDIRGRIHVRERSTANNVSYRRVRLSEQGTAVHPL